MGARSRRLVFAAVVASLAACAAAAQPLFSRSQDPLAGARVFGLKGCARCHAVNGAGGTVGPDLGRVARPRSFYDLTTAMWNHRPRMVEEMRRQGVPRPELTPTDAADLIAFLYSIDYFDRPGNRDRGRRLFSFKRCVACHQHAGVGGVVGPNLDYLRGFASPISVATTMWNHGPAMTNVMTAVRVPRPALTGQDLRDLGAFLGARDGPAEGPAYVLPGHAAEGQRLFAERRCVQCHGSPGQGGQIAPDLAERARGRSLTDFAAAMWNKAPAMTAEMRARGVRVPTLTADEMADIVAYLYSVQYFADRGDPARGRKVAAAKGCTGCHRAAGGRARPLFTGRRFDSAASVAAALWNHPVVGPWPRFTAEEMADLTAALQQGGAR